MNNGGIFLETIQEDSFNDYLRSQLQPLLPQSQPLSLAVVLAEHDAKTAKFAVRSISITTGFEYFLTIVFPPNFKYCFLCMFNSNT